MLVHAVYFWLKKDLDAASVQAVRDGLESLRAIPSVTELYIGTPADTDRPIIDRTYAFALVVVFNDMTAHDAYQAHPIHKAFAENNSPKWEKIKIYDSR